MQTQGDYIYTLLRTFNYTYMLVCMLLLWVVVMYLPLGKNNIHFYHDQLSRQTRKEWINI